MSVGERHGSQLRANLLAKLRREENWKLEHCEGEEEYGTNKDYEQTDETAFTISFQINMFMGNISVLVSFKMFSLSSYVCQAYPIASLPT